MKVLVVEDDADVSSAVSDLLTTHGYTVTTAKSGVDALATLRTATSLPDVVLLDMGLPVMRGDEFLTEKAKLPEPARSLPVVVFTADTKAGEGSARFEDVKAVLQKPADLDVILDALQGAVGEPS